MAPNSSSSSAHPVYDMNMGQKLKAKENRLINLQNQILANRREQAELRHKQAEKKNKRETETRLSNWKTMFDIVKLPDASLRPPDKTNNIRTYSVMDKDLWDGGERGEVLRGWFLSQAPKLTGHEKIKSYNAEKSGFLVKNMNRREPTPDVYEVDHNRYTLTNPRAYSIPENPAGFPGVF